MQEKYRLGTKKCNFKFDIDLYDLRECVESFLFLLLQKITASMASKLFLKIQKCKLTLAKLLEYEDLI